MVDPVRVVRVVGFEVTAGLLPLGVLLSVVRLQDLVVQVVVPRGRRLSLLRRMLLPWVVVVVLVVLLLLKAVIQAEVIGHVGDFSLLVALQQIVDVYHSRLVCFLPTLTERRQRAIHAAHLSQSETSTKSSLGTS